jgi:hypothetical protein
MFSNKKEKLMTLQISLAELRLKNDLLEITPTKQFNSNFTIQRSDISVFQGRFQLKLTLTKTKIKDSVLCNNDFIKNNDNLYIEFFFTNNYPYEVPSCLLINNENFNFPFVCTLTGIVKLKTLTYWKTEYTLNIVINDLINTISEYETRIDKININPKYNLLNGLTEQNYKKLQLNFNEYSHKIINDFKIGNLELNYYKDDSKLVNESNNMLIDDDFQIEKNKNEYLKNQIYNSNIVNQFLKKCKLDSLDNPLMYSNSCKYKSKRYLKDLSYN